MRQLRVWAVRFGELSHRKRRDQELADEIDAHVQMHTEDNLRAGMTPFEARRQALIKLGGMESTVEIYRERRGFSFSGTVLQDLRYAVRMLRKSPGFTAAVVLSLALGIGANTAIFSLINAVMWKFLPVKDPEQLVLLKWTAQQRPSSIESISGDLDQDKTGRITTTAFSYAAFKELQAQRNIFSSTFAFTPIYDGKINFNADGQAGLAEGELTSGEYFSGLGIKAATGRLLMDSDDRPESPLTAVISYGYWERRFGRNHSVVGKAIAINGAPFTIVGVAPPNFFGLRPGTASDVWMPLSAQPQIEPRWSRQGRSEFLARGDWWLLVMGRLQPGVSRSQALTRLDVVLKQSAVDPEAKPLGLDQSRLAPTALPFLEFDPGGKGIQELREEFSKPLLVLMAVVGLVLLIACANVANLLLARATSRYKEIAVRMAVGAARTRLIRQLLTESVLLAAVGGTLGLGLAYWATHLLVALMASGREPVSLNVHPDMYVLGFTAVVSLITGMVFGIVPALRGTRLELTSALKEDSRGSAARLQHVRIGLGKLLVISQVAVSLLLLVGAGLYVRTLTNLEGVNAGFDRRNVLLFGIDPTQNGYTGDKVAEFYHELQRKIEELPGVRSVTLSRHSLIGDGVSTSDISIQGYAPFPGELSNGALHVFVDQVGPRFFETMTIPLMLGRSIEEGDNGNVPKVAVINETLARKYFGNSSPIGRRFGFGAGKTIPDIEIVGVVADTKYSNLRQEVPPTVYIPAFQNPNLGFIRFEVRTLGDPRNTISAIRHAVQTLDPNLPLSDVRTQVEQIDQTLFQERLFAKLSSFFGLLALVLACIGLYGIMSYAVARRTNEIGIRMALGARREDILRKVLREALALVLVGVAIGIPIALGALRLISSMLFGLKPTDPLTLAGAIAFMLAVAAIAGYLPARRASRVDPMVALRYE